MRNAKEFKALAVPGDGGAGVGVTWLGDRVRIGVRYGSREVSVVVMNREAIAFAKEILALAGEPVQAEPVQTEPVLASLEDVEEFTRGLAEAERLRHVLEHAVD